MLTVNTKKCDETAPVKYDSARQFNVGMTIMALGVSNITEKNLDDALRRLRFLNNITEWPLSSRDLILTGKNLREAIGIEANVTPVPFAKWQKERLKGFVNSFNWKYRDGYATSELDEAIAEQAQSADASK